MLRKSAVVSIFIVLALLAGCAGSPVADREPIEVWGCKWKESPGTVIHLDGAVRLVVFEKTPLEEKNAFRMSGRLQSSGVVSAESWRANYQFNLPWEGSLQEQSLMAKAKGISRTDDGCMDRVAGDLIGTISRTEAVVHCDLTLFPDDNPRQYPLKGDLQLKPVP